MTNIDDYPNEFLDEDGYPTEFALDKIRTWDYTEGFDKLLEFVGSLWAYADAGYWTVERDVPDYYSSSKVWDIYTISTAGWSGNEDIIRALEGNRIFWMSCWYQSTRGGHYIFHVKNEELSVNNTTLDNAG